MSNINPIGSPEWLAEMRVFEDTVYKNEKEFCEKFIKSKGFWQFTKLSVNADSIYFTWVEWNGQHITSDASLQEVIGWLKTLKNEIQEIKQ